MFIGPKHQELQRHDHRDPRARDNDLVVNPNKVKKLTNIRTTAADEKLVLAPPRQLTLEVRTGVHQRRRARRGDPTVDPPTQDDPGSQRPQALREEAGRKSPIDYFAGRSARRRPTETRSRRRIDVRGAQRAERGPRGSRSRSHSRRLDSTSIRATSAAGTDASVVVELPIASTDWRPRAPRPTLTSRYALLLEHDRSDPAVVLVEAIEHGVFDEGELVGQRHVPLPRRRCGSCTSLIRSRMI